jgi:hypothetical protein
MLLCFVTNAPCVQGIRIIKLFAWEADFLDRIMSARAREIALLKMYMFTLGAFMVTVKSSPTIVGLVTFLVHTQARPTISSLDTVPRTHEGTSSVHVVLH